MTSAPVASAGRSPLSSSAWAETTRAPAAAAQIVARWVLPEPSGPTSATALAGQSGQQSDRNPALVKRVGGNDPRPGGGRPDRRQMGFARALRPDQRDGVGRPIRPAIDQRQRILVGRPGEKILAGITFRVIERERELTRNGGR